MSDTAYYEQGIGVDAQPDPDYWNKLLSEKDAALFLGYSVRALQNWRFRGGGPDFIKVSQRSIRYRRKDLVRWAEENTVSNTAAY